jgi:hypothetical protein
MVFNDEDFVVLMTEAFFFFFFFFFFFYAVVNYLFSDDLRSPWYIPHERSKFAKDIFARNKVFESESDLESGEIDLDDNVELSRVEGHDDETCEKHENEFMGEGVKSDTRQQQNQEVKALDLLRDHQPFQQLQRETPLYTPPTLLSISPPPHQRQRPSLVIPAEILKVASQGREFAAAASATAGEELVKTGTVAAITFDPSPEIQNQNIRFHIKPSTTVSRKPVILSSSKSFSSIKMSSRSNTGKTPTGTSAFASTSSSTIKHGSTNSKKRFTQKEQRQLLPKLLFKSFLLSIVTIVSFTTALLLPTVVVLGHSILLQSEMFVAAAFVDVCWTPVRSGLLMLNIQLAEKVRNIFMFDICIWLKFTRSPTP